MNEVDKPGSEVEKYVASLDQLLKQKIAMITDMRKQLITFHTHLKTEEAMSKLYQEQQQMQSEQEYYQTGGNNDFANELMMDNMNYGDEGQQMMEENLVEGADDEGLMNDYNDEEMLLNDDNGVAGMQDMIEGGEDNYFYN